MAVSFSSEAQPRAGTPEVLPPPSGGAGPAADAPAGSGSGSGSQQQGAAGEGKASPKSSSNLGGYAYDDKPARKTTAGAAPRGRYRHSGPVVNIPGFEQTTDGGSRLFVQLSQNVPVEERKAQGTITYVLKGASPRVWNNTNALVTVHFNTPVSRARLVPSGQDLQFIVELRSNASPTWKMSDMPDKSTMLTIDFPKGDYLTGAPADVPAAQPQPEGKPAKRGGGKRGPAKPAPNTNGAAKPDEVAPPATN